MKKIFSILTCLVIVTSLSAQTVVDIVVNSPDHNTLETAVIAAELADDLSADGPFTLFAPTDAAFAAIDPAVLDVLLSDPTGDLATILLFHGVIGVADSSNIQDGLSIGSIMGQNLTFTTAGGLKVNNAGITVTDIQAENGVVHVIDAVMLPEAMMTRPATIMDVVSTSPDHTQLNALIGAAELDDDLRSAGPFTLFAPTDAAIGALPQDVVDALLDDPTGDLAQILLFHATSGVATTQNVMDGTAIGSLQGGNLTFSITGNGVMINDANVTVLDIRTDNGVVHVIDAVLLP